jgi:hypothetical protein
LAITAAEKHLARALNGFNPGKKKPELRKVKSAGIQV